MFIFDYFDNDLPMRPFWNPYRFQFGSIWSMLGLSLLWSSISLVRLHHTVGPNPERTEGQSSNCCAKVSTKWAIMAP
jgi:hypothetical protein